MYIIFIIQNEDPCGKVNKETREEMLLDFNFRTHGNDERDKTTLPNIAKNWVPRAKTRQMGNENHIHKLEVFCCMELQVKPLNN